MSGYRPPRLLDPSDHLGSFSSRSNEQTSWLRRHAHQSIAAGSTMTYVVTEDDTEQVVAYYAWCMAQLTIGSAPERMRRGAGRYPQPVALLARLAVDVDHEGRGLGAGMLADVVLRLVSLSEEIGCRGLLIHAETAEARDFYQQLVPELSASPTDDLHLVLLMKDARRTLLG